MYHWPNIPPPFTPRAMRFWACGPGGRHRAGDPQVRWLLPVQVPGRHRLPGKLFVHAMPPPGGLSLNATTAGAVRLVQLRPDAGGCFRPPQGSWKSGRKAIGRVSRYAKQTYYSLIRHGNVSNTCQEPTVTSIIDAEENDGLGGIGVPGQTSSIMPAPLTPGGRDDDTEGPGAAAPPTERDDGGVQHIGYLLGRLPTLRHALPFGYFWAAVSFKTDFQR